MDNEQNSIYVNFNSVPVGISADYLIHSSSYVESNKTEIEVTIEGSEYTIKANPENIFEVANEYGLEMIIK
jgi:hypothetical protein